MYHLWIVFCLVKIFYLMYTVILVYKWYRVKDLFIFLQISHWRYSISLCHSLSSGQFISGFSDFDSCMDRFGDTAVSASTSIESVNFRQSVPKRNSVIWFRSHIAVIFGKISAFFHDSEPLPLPIFSKMPNFSCNFLLRSSLIINH